MSLDRWLKASIGITRRQLVRVFTVPYLLLPSVLLPLLIFAAFTGGASVISKIPTFDYYSYTAFQFVYVIMMSAGLIGVSVGLAAAQDLESGFARRLMAAVPRRSALIAGYAVAGLVIQLAVLAVILVIALAVGMRMRGSALELIGLFALASLFNVAANLYAIGLAMRARSVQVGPAMNLPVFLPLFFAPTYAPRELLTDWLHKIANWNPVTPLLEAGRGLLAGDPVSVGAAFGIFGGIALLMAIFAVTGLRKAERTV